VKIGPILGLMGTLIPMGPALLGLATGDVASMASNMQVAFATTVVGLIIGAVGFITLQARQRWVAGEMNLLTYVAEKLKGGLA
ncbi:MAG: MotA/TolQ/ExbB proton channel family protein, partial [Bacteroidales bacterium]|nr:MotA/TolQ/ExbB proton channel family protein [Bacteroidales bacterium]